MNKKLNVLGINGSASRNSSNLAVLNMVAKFGHDKFNLCMLDDLSKLPHFQTELTDENTPEQIVELRRKIERADGVIISTPEYVFSIPSGLKNLIEWCVSETIFSDKPLGLITASSHGEKGHEELKLLMKTIQARYTDETTLLIQGIKGKVTDEGEINDKKTLSDLEKFVDAFIGLM